MPRHSDQRMSEVGHFAYRSQDPAIRAAALLLRLGYAIFALVIPSATLMSRWVIVVLVPIGAVLIIIANLIRDDPARFMAQVTGPLATIPGLLALFFGFWALESLAWTPLPSEAANKLFKALGVIVLGYLAVIALPMRMRASNLHLVTIGVALGAMLILIANISMMAGQPLLQFPAATPGRVAVLLTSLVWLGAAWMLIQNRRALALGLVVLVIGAVALGAAQEALVPLIVGVLVLGLAWNAPERIGAVLAACFALIVLAAPLLPFAAEQAKGLLDQQRPAGLAAVALWWDVIAADPLRILTGRGFDAANAARNAGLIAPEIRVGILSDIWYDLGLLGALGLAGIVYFGFRAAGRFGYELAPSALAALSAAWVFAVLERGATQTWWLNGMSVVAVVLMSVERGRYRTVRPRAELNRRDDGARPVGPIAPIGSQRRR